MYQEFATGTPVFDATGKKVGTVSSHGVQGSYLPVRRGLIFHQTVYVPLDAIRRTDARGIHLRLYKTYLKQPEEKDSLTAQPGVANDDTLEFTPPIFASPIEEHDDVRVPLHEERLVVGKERREMGRIRVRKYIVEEQQTITLPVTHEEFRVERVPIMGNVNPGPNSFTDKLIEVPLMGEAVHVAKQVNVVEEIHLYKSEVTEERAVLDVIRKERLHVDGMDDPTQEIQSPGQAY